MPAHTIHQCTGCRQEWITNRWSRRVYFIDYRNHAPLLSEPAYCAHCDAAVDAEELLSATEIETIIRECERDRMFAQWEPSLDEIVRIAAGDHRHDGDFRNRYFASGLWQTVEQCFTQHGPLGDEKFHRVLKTLQLWRALRKSPPRCLSCGDTDVNFDLSSKPRHKKCGGAIDGGHGEWFQSVYIGPIAELYTVEGDLIQRKQT